MGQLLYGDAIHIREQAKIEAARVTQKSGNERRGAESELQRFSASLANQRRMDAAGKNVTNITENISRNMDAASFGTFMGRVAAAEELGAHVAMASAAGVGGSSVEVYNSTLRLNAAMQEEQNARAVNSDNINASRQRGDMIVDAVAGLDNSIYSASLDFNEYVDHKKQGTFSKLMTLGLAAGATYFGGPQAGMAVIGLSEAGQAARNGDFASANQSVMGAVSNAYGGVKAYRAAEGPVMAGLWKSTERTMDGVKLSIGPASVGPGGYRPTTYR